MTVVVVADAPTTFPCQETDGLPGTLGFIPRTLAIPTSANHVRLRHRTLD